MYLSELSKSGSWFAIGDVANGSGTVKNGAFYTKSPTDPCTTDPAVISAWAAGWLRAPDVEALVASR